MNGSLKVDLKEDTCLREFWRDNERFSDLFNAYFFHGEKRVRPEDLVPEDTSISGSIRSKNALMTLERTRDVVKRDKQGRIYTLLAVEFQSEIHYAMPLRTMVYDAMEYLYQTGTMKRKHEGERLEVAEFLSGMKKEDRLAPCYTLVLYTGDRAWDGPRRLSEMMEFPDERFRKMFCDYDMNLVCMRDAQALPFADQDVKDLFALVAELYEHGGKELSDSFKEVSVEVALTAAVVADSMGLLGKALKSAQEKGEVKVNMCEAVKKAFEEERAEGIEIGQAQGRVLERDEMVLRMLRANADLSLIQQVSGLGLQEIEQLRPMSR